MFDPVTGVNAGPKRSAKSPVNGAHQAFIPRAEQYWV